MVKTEISNKRRMKEAVRLCFFLIVQLAGLFFLFYPYISEYLASKASDSLITAYKEEAVYSENEQVLKEAKKYNQTLAENCIMKSDSYAESAGVSKEVYDSMLKLDEVNGMMGFITIPCISVELPIFHGTSDTVLKEGAGHLMGTSLPVGGENTHAVLTGHTGLNSAKLFTDLIDMEKGDMFFISVLNQKLCYEVTEIHVVDPSDQSQLRIKKGRDLCTLVTCTPYGVNSHRLLVTGERVPNMDIETVDSYEKSNEMKDSKWLTEYKNAIWTGVCLCFLLILLLLISGTVRRAYKNIHHRSG